MRNEDILNYWYADIYEQQENYTDDVVFLLKLMNSAPQRVLEVACGGGRISVPLAQAGHDVTGFDMNHAALERLGRRAAGMSNLKAYAMDAFAGDWGEGYEVVVMGGNLLINIEGDMPYEAAQRLFLHKSFAALRPGGHLFLDFDCADEHECSYKSEALRVIFEGTDDRGTYGRFEVARDDYDAATRTLTIERRFTIHPKGGEVFNATNASYKHWPYWQQVERWLIDAGFVIDAVYGDREGSPFAGGAGRATVWARRP